MKKLNESTLVETKKAQGSFKIDAYLLKKFVNLVEVVKDEPIFDFSKDGVHCRHMNDSRVSMIDILLKSDAILPIFVNDSGRFSIQINTVIRELQRIEKGESAFVAIELDRLAVSLVGKEQFRQFLVPLMETEVEETPKPKVPKEKLVYAKIRIKPFLRILRDVGDYMELKTDLQTLVMSRGGKDSLYNYYARLDKQIHSGIEELTISSDDQKALFSMAYLIDAVRNFQNFSDVIELEFSSDMPLKIFFDNEIMTLQYWVAPRIEVE